jgi:ribosome-associated protein
LRNRRAWRGFSGGDSTSSAVVSDTSVNGAIELPLLPVDQILTLSVVCRVQFCGRRKMIDMTDNIPAVPIRDEMIRLGQFLKLANLIESGAEAKEVIADGMVSVNGEVEDRRGRQLRDGDVVEIGGMAAKVEAPA